jgi:predicted RND superfamily exporter protein
VFTNSWAEPIVLLLTLGISIIINMGTNIILPATSIISFAASAILQLGLAMDYAIFFLHALREERKHQPNFESAVVSAVPRTFKTVLASALTTVGGFLGIVFYEIFDWRGFRSSACKGYCYVLAYCCIF